MLPAELFRFKDLRRVGIHNHPTLKRWQKTQGFPKGRLIGPNTRVWSSEEVEAWWESKADPPPEIVKAAPLLQEGSRRVVKEDRHQSSTASDSAAQATSREDEE
jgi:predicted DNA-binding transcriptional regulator AlpA